MKKKIRIIVPTILILLVISAIVLIVLDIIGNRKKEITHIKDIKSLEFRYSTNISSNSEVVYELDGDNYVVSVKPAKVLAENKQRVKVDKSFVKEVEKLLIMLLMF